MTASSPPPGQHSGALLAAATGPVSASPLFLREPEIRRGIELLMFAHRELARAAAPVLGRHALGLAHQRALYFIARRPGLSVGDLIGLLGITKQSLGRVLKQLVDEGYVVQKEGENDRRQRLLFVTTKGEQLAMKLAGLQTERIARALADIGPNAHEAARRFLVAMIDADGRDGVQKLIARADRARRPRT